MFCYTLCTILGVTYVRWGRNACPDTPGMQLIYSGRAGGAWWNSRGGGVEKLCLPGNPVYLNDTTMISTTLSSTSFVHGAEYQFSDGPNSNLNDNNVPCAVCYASTREIAIMIPATTECPSTWTREYYGYLTAESETNRRSSYTCVDVNPEAIENTSADGNGTLFYFVRSFCYTNGLDCPPYEHDRALSCVMCSK